MELFLNTCTICANLLFIYWIYAGWRQSITHVDFTHKELNKLIENRKKILNQIKTFYESGCSGDAYYTVYYDRNHFTEDVDQLPRYITVEKREIMLLSEIRVLNDKIAYSNDMRPQFRVFRFAITIIIFTIVFSILYCITYG